MITVLAYVINIEIAITLLFYTRVNEKYGLLVYLIQRCLHDIKEYFLFIISWFMFFVLESMVLGNRIDDEPGTGNLGYIARTA